MGLIQDPQGEPVEGATVRAIVNGDDQDEQEDAAAEADLPESQANGAFLLELPADIPLETLRLEITRPHFTAVTWSATPAQLETLNAGHALQIDPLVMERKVTPAFWIATLTFVAILVLIALERLHNTMAALLGAGIVLAVSYVGGALDENFFIFGFDRALEYVNFDVVFLVMGMMIVIAVIEETGIFQWLAYQSYRLSGGRVWLLVVILMLITSVASALLDNVTTMLLMTPMSIQIALALGIQSALAGIARGAGLQRRRHQHADRHADEHSDRLLCPPEL